MSFETDLRAIALEHVALSALIGDRFVWGQLPQAQALPSISAWNVTRDDPRTMDRRTGYAVAYLQLDCWSETYLEAGRVADALSRFLEGLYRTAADGGTVMQGAFLQGRRDGNEPSQGSPAARYFRVSIDANVHWTAAPAT